MRGALRIVLASLPVADGDKTANLRMMEEVLRDHDGADIVIFPELSLCGFPRGKDKTPDCVLLAEPVPEGPTVQAVAQLARDYQTRVIAGILEAGGDHYFITQFMCGPAGYEAKQRKLIPKPPGSDRPYQAGDHLGVHEVAGYRCAIMACADWLLLEAGDLAGFNEVDLILAPTDCYTAENEIYLRAAGLARNLNTGATVAAVFGGSEAALEDEVMAALVVHSTSEAREVILCETRRAGEVRVCEVTVTPSHREPVRGDVAARADVVRRHLPPLG